MSEELEIITDHESEAFALLIEQFKNATNLKSFLSAFLSRVQEIEDMLFDLWESRWLDNATGVQLDGLGDIVGIERGNDSDDVYRVRIRARIYTNVSRGTPDDIIQIASLLSSLQSSEIQFLEFYPAYFEVTVISQQDNDASVIDSLLEAITQARPAGVGFALIYALVSDDETFTLSPINDVVSSTTQGLSQTAMTTGGHLAGVASYGG